MNSKRARLRSVVLVNNKYFICTNIKQSRIWKEFVWNQQNCDWSKSWVLIQKKEVLMCGTKQETMLALTSSLNSFNYDRKLQQKGGLSLQVGLSQRGTMLTDTNNTIYVRKNVRNYGSGLSTMMLVINWWTLTCKEAELRENGKSDFLWVGSATHYGKKSCETDAVWFWAIYPYTHRSFICYDPHYQDRSLALLRSTALLRSLLKSRERGVNVYQLTASIPFIIDP